MRYPQIDLLKGFAIVSVLLLHTMPESIRLFPLSAFTTWQAVPVFMVIMGITLYLSPIMDWTEYIQKKVKRFLLPFLVIFALSLVNGLIWADGYNLGWLSLIGLMPVPGPGNYFVSALLQFMIAAPVILLSYKRFPRLTILLMFTLDLAFEVGYRYIPVFNAYPYLYDSALIRYFAAIALGLHLGKQIVKKSDISFNKVGWILVFLSALYIAVAGLHFRNERFVFSNWGIQNILSVFYPLFLVVTGVKYLARFKNGLLTLLGKASYHIFLVQILYFRWVYDLVTKDLNIWTVIAGLTIPCFLGILFYKADAWIQSVRQISREFTCEG